MRKKKRAASPLQDLYRYSACLAPRFASRIFTMARTPFGEIQAENLSASNFLKVVSATVDPMDYTNADTFGRDYLCAELMSKYPSWDLGIDTAQVALSKFELAETLCRETNTFLKSGVGSPVIGPPTDAVLVSAARKINHLLGPFSWTDVFRATAWGPGATTRLSRRHRDAYYKFGGCPHVTHDLFPIAAKMVKSVPGWDPRYLEVVHGNKVTTVPKNAKTDRIIAIEPDLNLIVQKGIGAMLRRRLNSVGLLHTFAQEENAKLAREGSITGDFATIDLSSASDTISYELVRSLLPPRWLEALEQCRSPVGVLPSGETIQYQKFSSMGNGYTFELETLLFWSIARAVVDSMKLRERRVLVYGDDIIVPTDSAEVLIGVLDRFGFKTNLKKTFVSGPFRESCGKHYFNGSDVTPFYVRKEIKSIDRLYWLANSIKRWSRMPWGLDPRFRGVYDDVVAAIPPAWRTLMIPEGRGDGGLVTDFDQACPQSLFSSTEKRFWEGYKYKTIAEVTSSFVPTDPAFLLRTLYSLDRRGQRGEVEETGLGVPSYRKKWKFVHSSVPQWPTFGPWLGD